MISTFRILGREAAVVAKSPLFESHELGDYAVPDAAGDAAESSLAPRFGARDDRRGGTERAEACSAAADLRPPVQGNFGMGVKAASSRRTPKGRRQVWRRLRQPHGTARFFGPPQAAALRMTEIMVERDGGAGDERVGRRETRTVTRLRQGPRHRRARE